MSTRLRKLPSGWYPLVRRELEATLGAWTRLDEAAVAPGAVAAVAPHAGWYYSGRIAWSAWRSAMHADAVVVLGGHTPGGYDFKFYPEDGFETPLGTLESDGDLTTELARWSNAVEDHSADNTIEVHLPMAAARFPGVPVSCFRIPNDERAIGFGSALAEYARRTGKHLFVIGSTDLTHYGSAYGYEPGGKGSDGFPWARRADQAIMDAFKKMDEQTALRRAEEDASACSVGAAVAAIAYAKELGADCARLLMRGSSDELTPDADSSVGYCAMAFLKRSQGSRPTTTAL